LIRLLFITKNRHKVIEAQISIEQVGLGKFINLELLEIPKLEIQSDDLKEIAIFAARNVYKRLEERKAIVVEDAGLFIESLNGFPGPYSNYVYRTIGIKGILKLLKGIDNRRAEFVSVIVVIHPEFGEMVFEGKAQGYIAYEAKGDKGFGFDPIFIPKGHSKTFAEMNIEEKCRYSHRGAAFRALARWFASKLKDLQPLDKVSRDRE